MYNANLEKVDLSGAKLSRAVLRKVRLTKAMLNKAELIGAKLNSAVLRDANLSNAILKEADLSWADLSDALLYNTDLSKANLRNTSLKRAIFVESNLEGADLSNSSVYGISAWNLKTNKDTTQLNLAITKQNEPIITVDDIEVAQFIYLLIRYEKLRKVINSVTQKGVLLLGRFGGGGIEVLRAVAEKLRKMKYLPIIFDFERPRDRNYTETVKTLAGLSSFVVVDLSGPSVPQELTATVPDFKIPFVPIMEKDKQPYSMFDDILEYEWVIEPIVEFDTIDSLIDSLPTKVVEPAERRLEMRRKRLFKIFGK